MILASVTSPLLYLLLPLLASVALLPAWRGQATARLIIASFAVASLSIGTGSLAVDELAAWAGQGRSQALFVSLSIGIAIGGLGLWSRRGWLWWATALPLAAALLVVSWSSLRALPFLLGVVLGALPLLVATLVPRSVATGNPASVLIMGRVDWFLMLVSIVAAGSNRLVLVTLTPMLPLLDRKPEPAVRGKHHLVLPLLASLLLVALGCYAVSLAASPWAVLTSIGFEVPLSGSVERVVGATILAAAVAMVAPWPLHRLGPGITLVPAAAFLVYRIAGSIAPLGITGWLPLVAMLLVPSAIVAAWRGYWANALGSVLLLAVPRPGWQGLAALLVAAVALVVTSPGNPRPPNRISFPEGGLEAALYAAAMVLAATAVLSHEVVLGTVLTAGLAIATARPRMASTTGVNRSSLPTFPPDGSDVTRTATTSLRLQRAGAPHRRADDADPPR